MPNHIKAVIEKLPRYDMVTNYRCGESIEELERADDGEWVRIEDVLAALLASERGTGAQERDEQDTTRPSGASATEDGRGSRPLTPILMELRDALDSLANEATGFLAMADSEAHGQTNLNCLQRKIDHARMVLGKAR